MRDIRYVVVHLPGPKWVPGRPPFEQEGVRAHVDHYRALHEQGKLVLGGPFLSAPGAVGMMIPAEGVTREEMEAHAAADPAVAAGLIEYEVREWMVGMKR